MERIIEKEAKDKLSKLAYLRPNSFPCKRTEEEINVQYKSILSLIEQEVLNAHDLGYIDGWMACADGKDKAERTTKGE